ncbi:hypothetical protein VN12_24090 [Pirellula sp. SH-Sr6A]|uniref:DUF4314 domain-containing protein n=1 Tax=Pirellula sp. SH-Sr6A TaxID=1632865 RepID=UPI00078B2B64|nr:DUF4314 domain-containing protein [Pirellula sp. SH-Sr6A]AMV35227.1 hypothetical protein VN12_24090 [Pirellula sp. SH-Sr6A]
MTRIPNVGDRIRLIAMPDDPDPIPRGSVGTVRKVHPHHGWTQVEVDWDSGRSLMLTIPGDIIKIITPENFQS